MGRFWSQAFSIFSARAQLIVICEWKGSNSKLKFEITVAVSSWARGSKNPTVGKIIPEPKLAVLLTHHQKRILSSHHGSRKQVQIRRNDERSRSKHLIAKQNLLFFPPELQRASKHSAPWKHRSRLRAGEREIERSRQSWQWNRTEEAVELRTNSQTESRKKFCSEMCSDSG